ncbi:MAG: GIY-YIG nuclease family protein [Clostridia bacterium]|nr:GIY-YIG nuclease family protein [Clostridia bacterium]
MINLHELVGIDETDFCNYKVHFATGGHDQQEPYKAFLIDDFKNWQEHQTEKNWSREYILSLIYYDKYIWMFGGVYKVLPTEPVPIEDANGWKGWKYETELTDKATEYIGRAFFRYKKEFRASYPTLELDPKNGEPIAKMPLSHILDKRVALTDFLGFDQVNIDYKTLKHIVSDNILSWKSALSNVKGIYLIVDTLSGKQYVGSAYGDDCIWQRWVNYAKDGHGGNVELKALLKTNGEEYKYNFKYSILEVCNMNLGNEYIIERETHWKEVLLTRRFGLNKN